MGKLINEGLSKMEPNRLEAAPKLFDQALKITVEVANIHNVRPYCLYLLGRYKEALLGLEEKLARDPTRKQARQLRNVISFKTCT